MKKLIFILIGVSLAISLSWAINNFKGQNEQILGGSVTATRYGGLGKDASAWTGLIRFTNGTSSTTTITDSDVPDTITISNNATTGYAGFTWATSSFAWATSNSAWINSTGTNAFNWATTSYSWATTALTYLNASSSNWNLGYSWATSSKTLLDASSTKWNLAYSWASSSLLSTTSAPTRVIQTYYQNTTGKWLFVNITAIASSSNVSFYVGAAKIGRAHV